MPSKYDKNMNFLCNSEINFNQFKIIFLEKFPKGSWQSLHITHNYLILIQTR